MSSSPLNERTSPTVAFNPFSPFLPGQFPPLREPSIPPRPPTPSEPIPPPPLPVRTQRHHVWPHSVDDELQLGTLSDPVFVRLHYPDGPYIRFLSYHICQHTTFNHTQSFNVTIDVRSGLSTASPVDDLSYYLTPHANTRSILLRQLGRAFYRDPSLSSNSFNAAWQSVSSS